MADHTNNFRLQLRGATDDATLEFNAKKPDPKIPGRVNIDRVATIELSLETLRDLVRVASRALEAVDRWKEDQAQVVLAPAPKPPAPTRKAFLLTNIPDGELN
jgi:hypothetical protein